MFKEIDMKRYLLFAGDNYYPAGGMSDFKKDFDTISDAKEYMKILQSEKYAPDWVEVYDLLDKKEVISSYE